MVASRVLVQADLPQLFVVEYAEHHDVGVRHGLGRVVHDGRAEPLEVAPAFGGAAQHQDVMPGRDKTRHHGAAHPPGADESDSHRG